MSGRVDALLPLYAAAQEASIPQFREAAFEWLKRRLPFDSGVFGTMSYSARGVGYRAFHLHRQPIEKVLDYPAIAHLDQAAAAMVRNVGHASVYSVARDLRPGPRAEPMRRYAERYGVAQSLTWCSREGDAGEAFALWRSARRQPFTPGQARLAECVAPHLFLALRINTGRFVSTPAVAIGNDHGVVVADTAGFITACDERSLGWLAREWHQWSPPRLPTPLLVALASPCGTHLGRTLEARAVVIGSMLTIRLRPCAAPAELTPAQARVADRLGRGGSYKEIGRELRLAPSTVRNHVHAIYLRLGVHSRSQFMEVRRPSFGA